MAALVVALGITATPAHAAPATPSGNAPVVATPAPAGFAPGAGPTYHFTDGARAVGDMSVLADSLPFNYTFEYEKSMESRRFKTTTGKVCNWTDVYSTVDITIDLWVDTLGTDVQQGSTATFPAAGGTHYYCWTGLNNNNTYYLWFHKGWAQGAGSVTNS
ncbi:hypothetical protein [Micromonospora sp. NPDC047074]|uniref:hypothetical protein n=1 Tax=Micromonospora sp. NPDC047074 TaxID=3154339 RepID=UPI0033FDAB3F